MLLSLQDDEKANKNDINEQTLKDRKTDKQKDIQTDYPVKAEKGDKKDKQYKMQRKKTKAEISTTMTK